MKQILREMKRDTFISFLHFYIILGGLGAFMLIRQLNPLLQFLGFIPGVDDIDAEEVVILSILGAFMFLFALGLFIMALFGFFQKRVRNFMAGLSERELNELVLDYQNPWKPDRRIRIGRLYTFVSHQGSHIFKNRDIVWVYGWCEKKRYGDHFYLSVYLLGQEKPEYVQVKEKTSAEVLDYYREHFPHIIVGRSDEAEYWYNRDKEQFLNLRYYKGQDDGFI